MKAIQIQNYEQVIGKCSQSMREKKRTEFIAEQGYFTSVRIPDITDPKDPEKQKQDKMAVMKKHLQQQVDEKEKFKREGEGQFFGMTDEEILLNQHTFRTMGLL